MPIWLGATIRSSDALSERGVAALAQLRGKRRVVRCAGSVGSSNVAFRGIKPDSGMARPFDGASGELPVPLASESCASTPLRHGAGSLVARQADARWIHGFLGHSKITTTERHRHAKAQPEDVDRLNRAFDIPIRGARSTDSALG